MLRIVHTSQDGAIYFFHRPSPVRLLILNGKKGESRELLRGSLLRMNKRDDTYRALLLEADGPIDTGRPVVVHRIGLVRGQMESTVDTQP